MERDLEVGSRGVGQQLERTAHERVALAEPVADRVERGRRQVDLLAAGEQEREGDRLRVSVGEARVVGLREQDRAPVACEAAERLVEGIASGGDLALLDRELIEDLAAQQPRERRDGSDERVDGGDRRRLPAQEVVEQRLERRGRRQAGSCRLERPALQLDLGEDRLAVAPQPPRGPVGVDQVRKVLLALPLAQVVAAEGGRVDRVPRPLDLDVAGDDAVDADGVVRPDAALGVPDLVVGDDGHAELLAGRGEERFERAANGRLAVSGTGQLALTRAAEVLNGARQP